MSFHFHRARKPDLVCIGAHKAGTTWLRQALGQHPGIWTPPFDELHFFDHAFVPEDRPWIQAHLARSLTRARSDAAEPGQADWLSRLCQPPLPDARWYAEAFGPAAPGQLALDVTPSYATLPEEGVAFAADFLPEARFLCIVRHPLDRAVSQIRVNAARRRGFDGSARAWMELAAAPVVSDRGGYAAFLPRWRRHLSARRLLLLPFGRISSAPTDLLRLIERFAGLPEARYRDLDKVVLPDPPLMPPDGVIAWLAERVEPEVTFLRREFGRNFIDVC